MDSSARSDLDAVHHFLARGTRVAIRQVTRSDVTEFTRLSAASIGLHNPWVYSPRSEKEFDAYLERFDGTSSLCFLIYALETQEMAGFVTLSGIIRSPYERGILGYGAFSASAGQGYMTEGLQLVVNYCFSELGLHRLEADIQPGNVRSIALAKRAGLHQESFSPDFIFIDGAWRDHERWVIIDKG